MRIQKENTDMGCKNNKRLTIWSGDKNSLVDLTSDYNFLGGHTRYNLFVQKVPYKHQPANRPTLRSDSVSWL